MAKFASVGYSNFQNYSYLIPSSLTAPPTQTSLCTIASAADFSNTEKPPCILATRTIFRRSLVFRFLFFFFCPFLFFFDWRLHIPRNLYVYDNLTHSDKTSSWRVNIKQLELITKHGLSFFFSFVRHERKQKTRK